MLRDKYESPPKRKASSDPGTYSLPVLSIVTDDVIGPHRQKCIAYNLTTLSVGTVVVMYG